MRVTRQRSLVFTVSWIALLVTGLATFSFGLVVVVLPLSDQQYLRSIGAASVGMGLFGVMITLTAFRRRERWAFFTLWYYPVFWVAHLAGNLPPGRDHVHQVVLIVLSLLGLLLPIGEFIPRRLRTRSLTDGYPDVRSSSLFSRPPASIVVHRRPNLVDSPFRKVASANTQACIGVHQSSVLALPGPHRFQSRPPQCTPIHRGGCRRGCQLSRRR
jgi:hypothetical protein